MAPAFVLGMDANGLGMARALGRAGVPVVGFDEDGLAPGLRSKYVEPARFPEGAEGRRRVEMILERARSWPTKGALMAASDRYLQLICDHWRKLASSFHMPAEDPAMIQGLVDKRRQMESARRAGVPVPDTWFPGSAQAAESLAAVLTYPVLLKPRLSHSWQGRGGRKGVMAQGPEEVLKELSLARGQGVELLVQELIPGDDTGLVSVAGYSHGAGRLSSLIAWRKERQFPLRLGVGCFVRSVHDAEAEALCRKLMRSLDYQGVFEAEFKRDARDGQLRLIEVNARSWLQNSLAEASGLNVNLMAYRRAMGSEDGGDGGPRPGLRWWDAHSDLQCFWELRQLGAIEASSWVRSWAGAESFAFWAVDDPLPALHRWGWGIGAVRLLAHLLKGPGRPGPG